MSAQFGRWNFGGKQLSPDDVYRIDAALAPYGPDSANRFAADGVDMQCHAFHTTEGAQHEWQALARSCGVVIAWDGRLDNRIEVARSLHVEHGFSDASLVSSAYERWGVDCLPRLIGDWAVAIWDPHNRWLILAVDFAGTRHLYYSLDRDQISWSTVLDPLVLAGGRSFSLCEEYVAGWLAYFPAAHLTPYAGIHAVPPSCFVQVQSGKCRTEKYWNFDFGRRIRYQSDREYEEHFRIAFGQAVSRRLRSDRPIIAELSGGMDSSAIVCMADKLIAEGSNAPAIQTLSYYDDSEPNWNERPYFSKVEEKRGRPGCHIDVSPDQSLSCDFEIGRYFSTPAAVIRRTERTKLFAAYLHSQAARVLLSGFAGDEVMGGVPTPFPELEDLLACGQLGELAHKLKIWALSMRKPWIHLLLGTVRPFLPSFARPTRKDRRPPMWLRAGFIKRNRAAFEGYEERLKLLGPLPSFQDNLATLDGLRRQLSCTALNPSALHEVRYPYLDRDLLEFLYAIPREQMVRPGQRRSLMRRALAGIVPAEILERKRKAFVARSAVKRLAADWNNLCGLACAAGGPLAEIVDVDRLACEMQAASRGQEVPIPALLRTLGLLAWWKTIEGQTVYGSNDLAFAATNQECLAGGRVHSTRERR